MKNQCMSHLEKSKTKHIKFENLLMSEYLKCNKSTTLSKTIFSVRAGTLDIKIWNSWNYENTLCVMCEMFEETIEHFMTCKTYGKKHQGKLIGDLYISIM